MCHQCSAELTARVKFRAHVPMDGYAHAQMAAIDALEPSLWHSLSNFDRLRLA